jgi:hypothetical protein
MLIASLRISRQVSPADQHKHQKIQAYDWVAAGLCSGFIVAILGHILTASALSMAFVSVNLIEIMVDLKPILPNQLENIFSENLVFIETAGFISLIFCLAFGAFLGWALSKWYLYEWAFDLWDGLMRALHRLSWPATSWGNRLLAALGGVLIAILVVADARISVGWLIFGSAVIFLVLVYRNPPRQMPNPGIILAFALAAAAFILLQFGGQVDLPLDEIWMRALLGLVASPGLALALWLFFDTRDSTTRPTWRFGILLVLTCMLAASQLIGGTSINLEGNVLQYDGDSWQALSVEGIHLGERNNFHFYIDRQDQLWAINGAGLILERQEENWYAYIAGTPGERQESFAGFLAPPYYIEDSHGHRWVAQGGNFGLFDPANIDEPFQKPVRDGSDVELELPIEKDNLFVVMGLVSDQDGNLWVATAMDGLVWLDGKRPVEQSDWQFLTVENSGLCSNKIMALLVDSHGDLWVGTHEGLCRFAGGKWDQPVSTHLKDAEIKVLFEDSQGGLWVGTDTGGSHWNGRNWQVLSSMPGWERDDYVATFFEDSRGNIWAGAKETTIRFNGRAWVEVIPDFAGRVFAENSHQILWVGGDTGLVQYNLDSGIEQRFSAENSALSADSIQDLVVDANGTLWISTFDFEIDDQPLSFWVLSGLSVLLFALFAGMVISSRRQAKAP